MQRYSLSIEAQQKLSFICRSVKGARTKEDARRAAWWAAITAGALPPEYAGISMTSVSDSMDISRAAVSKGARKCCARFDLPPSHYMKADSSSKSFRNSRIKFISQASAEKNEKVSTDVS